MAENKLREVMLDMAENIPDESAMILSMTGYYREAEQLVAELSLSDLRRLLATSISCSSAATHLTPKESLAGVEKVYKKLLLFERADFSTYLLRSVLDPKD